MPDPDVSVAVAGLLAGRVAVVTGAAHGLGAAVAETFARAGADLVLCDRDGSALSGVAARCTDAGRRVTTAELDVRDTGAVVALLEQSEAELGPLHVLVNNAGGTFWSPFTDVSPGGEQALLDLNLRSVLGVIRAALPHLSDGASIINVTSIEAHRGAPGFAVYAAAKAAVESLGKSLALELSDRRIRVNTLAPDAIPTVGDDALAEQFDEGGYERYAAKVPLGLGTPDDFANAALFFASDLSRWITGVTLHVDGGSHAGSGWTRGDDGRWLP